MTNFKSASTDKGSNLNLKIILATTVFGLMLLAIFLWIKTPDLFIYFNQAFCAH
ncbi:hypothetical protein [Acinetobacter lanii]|uniref:Signal pepetide n=1 Tax=Acinetobacter lanii TaxID=2715163 RepID=A0A6G8S2L9_9GAMM|nr:hypothetical protein [Acinetobacter lanii]QIO08397.1 hypothetical protein G8D99_04770 [Acinetobacter lanii]